MSADPVRHLKPAPEARDGQEPWWKVAPAPHPEPATATPATPQGARPATATPQPGAALEVAPGRALTLSQKAALNVAHWADRSQLTGGLLAELTGDPPSLRKHVRYVKGREWLPDGHPGGFIGPAGQIHGFTIGLVLVAAGAGLSWLGHKALRFWLTALFCGIATLILWVFVF